MRRITKLDVFRISKIKKNKCNNCISGIKSNNEIDSSILWIGCHLYADKFGISKDKLGDVLNHSGSSFRWTEEQARIIKSEGFNFWLIHTKGQSGYQSWLKNR